MKELKEIQCIIKDFTYEKQQMKQQIAEIESKRNILAQERNNKINLNRENAYTEEVKAKIFELGKQIRELGNQSQELQNKLDKRYLDIKNKVLNEINNNINSIKLEVKEHEEKRKRIQQCITKKENKDIRYEEQKQEFFNRFGRIPDLSEQAQKELELQEIEYNKNKQILEELNKKIKEQEDKIDNYVQFSNNFKKGNLTEYVKDIECKEEQLNKQEIFETLTKKIVEEVINPIVENIIENNIEYKTEPKKIDIDSDLNEEDSIILPFDEDKVENEEIKLLEEVKVEEFRPLEEVDIEDIQPLEEVKIEEIKLEEITPLEGVNLESINSFVEEDNFDKINSIIEESEQEKSLEEILAIEEEKISQEELNKKFTETNMDTYYQEKVNLITIDVKIEDGEIVYKALTSNDDCIKVYPRKSQTGNTLLRDKENREELKEILINYAIAEYRMFDKKIIKKIDPSICNVLILFAKKYNYDVQNLIYNYAMSFSKKDETEIERLPIITYNLTCLQEVDISKKEKDVMLKNCKNANKNNRINVIEYNDRIKKFKYILKRIFGLNNTSALPEGKY